MTAGSGSGEGLAISTGPHEMRQASTDAMAFSSLQRPDVGAAGECETAVVTA